MQHNDKHGHFTSEDAISSGEIGGTTYEARNRTTGSTAPSFNSFYDGIRPWGARKGSPRHSFWTLVALALSAFAVFFHLLVPFGEVFLAKGGWNLRGHGCTKKGQHDAYTVTFDNYSLIIGGQRVFLHSGEVHTFRLPVPSLWTDILEKAKAGGLNAISLYTHMGLINPSRTVVDFDGFRALEPFYKAASEAGLWVVVRPGPYINAETSAGGIAHWATSEVEGSLRTNATDWRAAWQAYIEGIIRVTKPYEISVGGPVIAIQIDNEYTQNPIDKAIYFEQLEDVFRRGGISVPLTYNDPGPRRNFINGTGAVDLYGVDYYPQEFDCSNPTVWKPVDETYHSYHQEVNPSQPWYIPEFQAGSYDAWGPTAPGYGPCHTLTGPDFQSVFNLHLWASNAKLINYYMFYGGTSWGAIPFHGVYTSYDYGAPVSESRELTTKYDELKRQGMFIRSSPDFYRTDWLGDTSTGLNVSSNPDVFVTHLKNTEGRASFYIVRHKDSTSQKTTNFHLSIQAETASLKIPIAAPSITLGGRESKLILADYTFGLGSTLLYSTAQVFFAGIIDNRDVLLLHGKREHHHEFSMRFSGVPNPAHVVDPSRVVLNSNPDLVGGAVIVNLLPGVQGLIPIHDSDDQLILYADSETAGTFWSPTLAGNKGDSFANFWSLGTNSSILVGGPYLVRSADLTGTTLALRGDLKTDVRLTVIAPKAVRKITWNGYDATPDLSLSRAVSSSGVFVTDLHTRHDLDGIRIPRLTGWKYKDNLPEIGKGYNDTHWTYANHIKTNLPLKPLYGDGRVLYGCDYGFCENAVIWRGHFNATGNEKSVRLAINGGEGFAASIWINDVFLGTAFGNSTNNQNIIEETDEVYDFPPNSLIHNGDNVLTIVQDNMGLNETDGQNTDASKSPRGIRGFELPENELFRQWKVQGKVGGYRHFPDKVRGIFNEGGFYGERKGWHLPGFPTDDWELRSLSDGLPNDQAGLGFFVTTFKLDIPKGLDVMLSFNFLEPEGQPYRASLFVNGWMMGKRIGNLGPQSRFPVHEGILDYRGQNTVAVALWAMLPNVTISPKLELSLDAVYDGGVGQVLTNNPPWTPVGRE